MAVSIIPQLIKGVKGSSRLKNILLKAEKESLVTNPMTGLKQLTAPQNVINKKLKIIAHRFKNPGDSDAVTAKKFGVSRTTVTRHTKNAGLSNPSNPSGFTKETKNEIQKIKKGFKKYKKEKGVNPSKAELSRYLGYKQGIGEKTSRISKISGNAQRIGVEDPFKNLNFKLGTRRGEGVPPRSGQIRRDQALKEFYSNPEIPKEVKQIRRDIDKTISEWNKEFPFDRKVIDHIDSYWNAASKEVPYEDVANWQIIGKKINGVKAALYENPMTGLKRLTNKFKNAKNFEEKKNSTKII
jgi:hypothetical protein